MSLLMSIAAVVAASAAPDDGPRCQAAALAASLGAGMQPDELRGAIQAAQAHPLGSREKSGAGLRSDR